MEKKLLFLLFFVCSLGISPSFASFPVVEQNQDTELTMLENEEMSSAMSAASPSSKTLGLLLGLLLGIFGVAIAYIMDDDTAVKYAWRGFGILAVVYLLLVITVFAGAAATTAAVM